VHVVNPVSEKEQPNSDVITFLARFHVVYMVRLIL